MLPRLVRIAIWRAVALALVALGLIGVVVPGLPTVPFLIAAAWAASRGWPAFEAWLLNHPKYGPPIRNWREHGAVPRRAKVAAVTMMSSSAIVLLEGTMVVRRNGRKVHSMSPGDIAGEMSLLDPAPRSATIVAEGDCLVLEIGGADFRLVLDEIPQVTHKLLTTMAARVRDLDTAVLG